MNPCLLEVENKLDHVSHLVEAIYMATSDIGDLTKVNALHAVIVTAADRLEEVSGMVKALRSAEWARAK